MRAGSPAPAASVPWAVPAWEGRSSTASSPCKGPNGYETISERTGTVSAVTDTSGSTWSLTVKSADGTTGTFTVDSGTSVNGGRDGHRERQDR